MRILGLLISTMAVSTPVDAQISPSQTYLMAFHVCEGELCRNFRNHTVYLAESPDGAAWSLVPGWTPFAGSVPDVIQRGRTLYVYAMPQIVARYNLDTGTSDLVPVAVHGLPSGGVTDWVDPSLYLDDEGRLVLFMMHAPAPSRDRPPSDPAGCPPDATACTKEFYSATEVPGSDGTEFVVDLGVRVAVPISTQTRLQMAADPDIFFDGTQYVLYISHGPSVSMWTSPTLRGTYVRSTVLPDGLLSNNRGGVPSGHFDAATSRYWTYTHQGQPGGATMIRRAVHPTLVSPPPDASWEPVMTGATIGLGPHISVESPGFAVFAPAPLPPATPMTCPLLTLPGPLAAGVAGDTITLTWGGVAGAHDYAVELSRASEAFMVAARTRGETSISLTHVPSGTYTVRVRARNTCGESTVSPGLVVRVR